ncbi:PAS domain S-box protein [Flexistipes sp.]|uniref:PAS domain S-box protein n=1 Tax=Flexistipes sp. TaxID=3088135 RepID=UPI002E235D9B|nr:PAS domain S-box protein [Flexistipes sp.]
MEDFLSLIIKEMETFLENWTFYMNEAGYLEHTTAKKDDCILSLQGIIDALNIAIEENPDLNFSKLIKDQKNISDFLIKTADRHKARGVNAEMFFGCFKTLLHSIDDIILNLNLDESEKLKKYIALRRAFDAMEIISIEDWASLDSKSYIEMLSEQNRKLTLEKNKYENIFEATSDLVFVIDDSGNILEMNESAFQSFPDISLGMNVLNILGFQNYSSDEFINQFLYSEGHEITIPEKDSVYSMVIVPLKKISLASAGYVIILNDITCIVDQRIQLEKTVKERTEALRKSEKLFRSLFVSAGEGIVLADKNYKILQVNPKAAEIFKTSVENIVNVSCVSIIHPGNIDDFYVSAAMSEGDIISNEMNCITFSGEIFPASVTINKFKLNDKDFLHIIFKDISQQKSMEEYLKKEKAQAEEMNVTLKNVLKSIDKEKDDLELSISQKITTNIIPSLQKLAMEDSKDVRNVYLETLKNQLINLTKSGDSLSSRDIAKLTKSEVQVCQMIQSGYSSKDISEAMRLSLETVQTHRKNIRKKLGLSGSSVSLYSYLNSK